MRRNPAVVLLLVVACAAGCSHEVELAPRETFRWSERAISFAPPPAEWGREGELSGGVRGVRFVKRGSPEAITVGEFHRIAERDRSEKIAKVLDELPRLDRSEFIRQTTLAAARTDDPLSDDEAEVARAVNEALDRARARHFENRMDLVYAELQNALREAKRFRVTLDDVVEKVALAPLQLTPPYDRKSATVGGERAEAIAWTGTYDGRTFARREVFFVRRNHLFVARFIGHEETVPLFDRVVASVEFPE